jgi:hypothetical protein
MPYGDLVAQRVQRFDTVEDQRITVVDPRPDTVGRCKETFAAYPNIGTLLPAMGYGEQQVKDREAVARNSAYDNPFRSASGRRTQATINATMCDTVVMRPAGA